jgi:hypothetical protein
VPRRSTTRRLRTATRPSASTLRTAGRTIAGRWRSCWIAGRRP